MRFKFSFLNSFLLFYNFRSELRMSKFYIIVFRCGTLELNLRIWLEMVEFKFEFCIQFSFFFFRPYSLAVSYTHLTLPTNREV